MVFTMQRLVRLLTAILGLNFSQQVLEAKGSKSHDYIALSDQIVRDVTDEISKEYNLVHIGGGGRMSTDVEVVTVQFVAYRRATIEEARELVLRLTEKFVVEINSRENIRPFLREFPFPAKRVSISIVFRNYFNAPFADGSVSHIYHVPIKDKIVYWAEEPFSIKSIDLHEEPYAEALKITQATPLKNPAVHQAREQEVVIDETFMAFAKEMRKELGLYSENMGGRMANDIEEISVRFVKFRPTGLEEARELEVLVSERLLRAINENEKLRPFLKKYPFTNDDVKVCIAFRDRKYFSYDDGSMERVTRVGDQVTYYAEPVYKKDAPVYFGVSVVAEESYKEAQKIVQETPKGKRKVKTKRL